CEGGKNGSALAVVPLARKMHPDEARKCLLRVLIAPRRAEISRSVYARAIFPAALAQGYSRSQARRREAREGETKEPANSSPHRAGADDVRTVRTTCVQESLYPHREGRTVIHTEHQAPWVAVITMPPNAWGAEERKYHGNGRDVLLQAFHW